MSKNLDFCVLLDLYGGLISGRQFEAMDYYYNQDLSLAEIGEILSGSRQAVRNSIKDGEENILMYEEKLGLFRKSELAKNKIEKIAKKIIRLNQELESEALKGLAEELIGIELI